MKTNLVQWVGHRISNRFFPLLAMISMVTLSGIEAQINRQHPGYTLVDIPLSGFNSGITGMDFLPDGKMVITTYRGDTAKSYGGTAFGRQTWGKAYIIDNIKGSGGATGITYKQVADQFIDAMGVKVIDGQIYVGEINRIIKLVDADSDGIYETKQTVADLPADDANLTYSYGPVYKDGFLYMALGSPIMARSAGRSSVVRVPLAGGTPEVIATGIRSPDGIGLGPDNEIFVTDNQGNMRPAPILTHIQPGKFYGFSFGGGGTSQPAVTSPSLHLPYNTFNNSPTQPIYMTTGRYAGQFIYGDWAKMALYRAFVEVVNDAYQGAAFFFTGRLKSPVHRMVMDENGILYLGEMTLATGPNGPQKLVPKPEVAVFEMLAVRSRQGGMEIEFTQPVGDMAMQANLYTLQNWHYTPTMNYYNDPQGVAPLTVANVRVSDDRLRVYLEISNLTAGKVVHIKVGAGLLSQAGGALWTPDAYYTLNAIAETPFQPTTPILAGRKSVSSDFMAKRISGNLELHWKLPGYTALVLQDIHGTTLKRFNVSGLQAFRVADDFSHSGLFIAKLQGKNLATAVKAIYPNR